MNTTAFVEISKSFTVGLEFNNSDSGNFDEEEPELPAMPQVHIEFSDHWSLQTGVGGAIVSLKVYATGLFV